MNTISRALAAALALAAGSACAAKAEGETYYFSDPPTLTYGYETAPRTYYYSDPVVVAPAPQIYYAPVYTRRSNTTYYYSGSNHDSYVRSSPGHTTYYQPRILNPAPPATTYYYSQPTYVAPAQPYGYVPPGLSITTPAGTYAPFYGGWSSYSIESDGYRIAR